MNDVKRINAIANNSVIRITETPKSLSEDLSQRYLEDVVRESNSLLEKLLALPKINDYRKGN